MQSLAISIVRNCQDIIALTVLHHILLGVDHCVVIDNGSTDGTLERLRHLARKLPQLDVRSDPTDFRQPEQVAAAANEHSRRRRMLVIPFDSDEFWQAPVSAVARRMAETDVNVLSCPILNYVQRRSVIGPTRFSWSFAFRRIAFPDPPDASRLAERHRSFVEFAYQRKVIWSTEGIVALAKGAHAIDFPGKREARCDDFVGLHLPLRSKQELTKRAVDFAPRTLAYRPNPDQSWQAEYFRNEIARGEEAAQWRANSYGADGMIDVFGRLRPTITDFRLVRQMWRAYAYGLYLGIPMGVQARPAGDPA